jgi:hypothetical protein
MKYFDIEGKEVKRPVKWIPPLCLGCQKCFQKKKEMSCNIIRAGRERKMEFFCSAYKPLEALRENYEAA